MGHGDGLKPVIRVVFVGTSEGLELGWDIHMFERWQDVRVGIYLPVA